MPGSTISSPVENSATRTRRRTSSSVEAEPRRRAPRAARRAGGRPAARPRPSRTSSPASRRLAPSFSPGGTITLIAVDRHVLLHEHGVGARRHRRAGEDADRLRPASSACAAARAGGEPSGDRSSRVSPSRVEIGVAHRVAVDRGIVERRQIDRRDHVARRARGRAPRASGTLSVSATGARARRSAAPCRRAAAAGRRTQSNRR